MKGIVSVGCSIAKGYGLWLYNNNYNKDTSNISNIQLNKHLRYTDIVSNYFNTFYIMNDFLSDTGDERQSLEFCERIMGDGFPHKPTDFSVLLFQLSWPGRCYLEYGDGLPILRTRTCRSPLAERCVPASLEVVSSSAQVWTRRSDDSKRCVMHGSGWAHGRQMILESRKYMETHETNWKSETERKSLSVME